MRITSQVCIRCNVKRGRKYFLRPYKQRLIAHSLCNFCYEAAFFKDTTGRSITRAVQRGEITEVKAQELHARMQQDREQRKAANKTKLRERMSRVWVKRRDLDRRFGIRTPTVREWKQFRADPEAHAAFNADQALRRAAYAAYLEKDAPRRAKISAANTGKKRGHYARHLRRINEILSRWD